jgi:hypothetical protein
MRKFVQFLLFAYTMLLTFTALAETVSIPRAANVRSSRTFYGNENILDQLPKDAQVEIISRRPLASGADALEIKIISPADKVSLNEKKPIYIWQSKTEIKNNLFKTEAGLSCPSGDCNDAKNQPNPVEALRNISLTIEEEASQPPEITSSDNTTVKNDGPLSGKIQAYSNGPEIQKMIAWARANNNIGRNRKGEFDGYCYRHVKEALATKTRAGVGPGNNLVPSWYASGNAITGGKDLKARGFVNLLDQEPYKKDMQNPQNIPKGAILIYSTVNHGYGHAEVKLDNDDYFFGITTKSPKLNNKNYKLLGVWIKDNV